MNTRFLTLLVFVASYTSAKAQNTLWSKSLGGSADERICGHLVTQDSGYIILGTTYSADGDVTNNKGVCDIWLIKLNSLHEIEYQRTIGGSLGDTALSINHTSDGNYIITARSYSDDMDFATTPGIGNTLIVKIDQTGFLLWSRRYGTGSINSIEETFDNGFIFCGYTAQDTSGFDDVWVGKINATGDLEWSKTYGGSSSDWGGDIHQTRDGGYILSATTFSNDGDIDTMQVGGAFDGWILKLNNIGAIEWQRVIGTDDWDFISRVRQTSDDGYVTVGSKFTGGKGTYIQVLKLSPTGGTEHDWLYGQPKDQNRGAGIEQIAEGGYIISGHTDSTQTKLQGKHGFDDIVVYRTDSAGTVLWKKYLGGTLFEIPSRFIEVTPSAYSISGQTSSTDDDVVGNHGKYDIWIIGLSEPTGSLRELEQYNIAVHPTPTSGSLRILSDVPYEAMSVSITDMRGKIVQTIESVPTGDTEIKVANIPSGTYFITLKNGSTILLQQKFIKH